MKTGVLERYAGSPRTAIRGCWNGTSGELERHSPGVLERYASADALDFTFLGKRLRSIFWPLHSAPTTSARLDLFGQTTPECASLYVYEVAANFVAKMLAIGSTGGRHCVEPTTQVLLEITEKNCLAAT